MHSEISAQLLYELSIKNIIQNNNMILTFMLISRHGKVRLIKWYHSFSAKDRKIIVKEVFLILATILD